MKIGIFSECYHPTTNGVVVSIDTFKASMEQMGHEVFIFAPKTKGYIDNDPTHVFRLPSFKWPGQSYYPLAFPFFDQAIAQTANLDLDIIHCQHLSMMGELGLTAARHLNIPVVYTYHTLIAEYTNYVPFFKGLAKKLILGRSRSFCNRCDAVVTPSPSMRKILLSYGVKTPINVIPTGIHPEKYSRDHRQQMLDKFQIPPGRRILLFVGRLAQEKNISLLIQTLKIIHQKNEQVHLLFVGSGPEESIYRQEVTKNNLDQFVTFAGFQPKDETEKIFGACDIFTFPSSTDTQGIVVTEALAAGTPAVVVDALGPADIVRDGVDGFLTPSDPQAFAAKILTILNNDSLYKKMSSDAKQRAEEFGDAACAKKKWPTSTKP